MIQSRGIARNHADFFNDALRSDFLSDIKLKTSDGVLIPAHRIILAAVSPTFKNMFSNGSTFKSAEEPVVEVPFSDEKSFAVILHYIYTGHIDNFLACNAVEVLEAAAYFQLDDLKDKAVDSLCRSTSEDNVFQRLDLALCYNCPVLREHCLMLVRQHNTEVIHSRDWLQLPLDVALLLVQETVIEGELSILRRCFEWCQANVPAEQIEGTLVKFLKFIDFTAMSVEEVETVEQMKCVPVTVLYNAFKRQCLGLQAAHTARNGGIILQWEMRGDEEISVVNNHVWKVGSDFVPRTVCAINKFTKGKHYWTMRVSELRLPHDCLLGVTHKDTQTSFTFEPCCMCVNAPSTAVVCKEEAAGPSVLVDRSCIIGVLLDFGDDSIRWFNHNTKELLFTLTLPDGEPLPHPLFPSVTLTHKNNGGVALSEATSFPASRHNLIEQSPQGAGLRHSPSKTSRGSLSPSARSR